MANLYSASGGSCGIWRAFVVTTDAVNKTARVFIPMLHRKLMPFLDPANPKNGIVENCEANYPVAQYVAPGVFYPLEVGDACWVQFEDADMQFPQIIGQLATCLPEGTYENALYGGGGGGYGGGTGGGSYGGGGVAASANVSANVSSWISVIQAVKSALAAVPGMEYDSYKYCTISVNGQTYSVRQDCSGMVSGCLTVFGTLSSPVSCATLMGSYTLTGFTKISFPGWENCVQGDILVRDGHMEIFSHNEGGKHYVWNGGSSNALCTPGPTSTAKGKTHTYVYRYTG